MARHPVKHELYAQFARVAKAMAHPHRLELLDLLSQGERTVESLAAETGLSVGNASQHLRHLLQARLVEVRREGWYAYYRMAGEKVFALFRQLQELAESRLAEVEHLVRLYFEEPQELDPMEAEELLERLRAGEVTVLDVRPEEEYRAGHIPGALSIPVEELEDRLAEVPRGREVVAYCRGPYCVFSVRAAHLLRERGFSARRLREGLPDWARRGLPVEGASW